MNPIAIDWLNWLKALWRRGRGQASSLNQQARGWPKILLKAVYLTFQPEAYLAAGAVAYFAFFSLFPLILLSIALASIWLDPALAQAYIMDRMEFVAPALGELLGTNLLQIVEARRSITGFALLALLWAASTIFHVITSALDQIWQVETARPVWRYRGLAILIVLGICAALLLASVISSALLTALNAWLPEGFHRLDRLWETASSLTVTAVLFTLLYRYLPHTDLTWGDVLPGALAAGLLWEAAKRIFLYFVANYLSVSNLVYGSVAAIIVFLTWAYFSSLIFFFGAYLNSERKKWKRRARLGAV